MNDQTEKPWKEIAKEMTIGSLQGMITEIENDRVGSPEWVLYRGLIVSGLNYFEGIASDEKKKNPERLS